MQFRALVFGVQHHSPRDSRAVPHVTPGQCVGGQRQGDRDSSREIVGHVPVPAYARPGHVAPEVGHVPAAWAHVSLRQYRTCVADA
eukprot:3426439-Rhodomonas_salina.1